MTSFPCILVTILIFAPTLVLAQGRDSIRSVLDTAKNQYKVKALNEMFRAEYNSDPVRAVGYAREALNYASEVGDMKGLAAAYNNLGVAYRTQGAMDKALDYYIHALRIYESLDHHEGISGTRNNIANVYSIKRDYDQSMKYMEESHKAFLEMNDTEKIIGSLNNLGNLHMEMQMNEKALEYYMQAYNLSEEKGGKFADPLTNIGNLYFKRNKFNEALGYYEKALQVEREANNQAGLTNALTNLGVTHMRLKKTSEATAHLDEALRICQATQSYSLLPAIYKAQAENLANQNRWKEAFETQRKYDDARELVFGEESTRRIAQMELRLAFEDMERRYEALKQEDAIKTLELRNTRLIIVVGVLAIMFTLGILNYVFLTRKRIIHRKAT